MWSNELEYEFLEKYHNEPVLWDPSHPQHKNKQSVNDAWERINQQMNIGTSIEDLKKKRESLMATYRGHKRKIQQSLQSGAGSDMVYQPIWFAFQYMNSFLGDVVSCKKTINTEPTQVSRYKLVFINFQ